MSLCLVQSVLYALFNPTARPIVTAKKQAIMIIAIIIPKVLEISKSFLVDWLSNEPGATFIVVII